MKTFLTKTFLCSFTLLMSVATTFSQINISINTDPDTNTVTVDAVSARDYDASGDGDSPNWGSGLMTIRIPDTIVPRSNFAPSPQVESASFDWAGQEYRDIFIPTNDPPTAYSLTDMGGPADDGFTYFVFTSPTIPGVPLGLGEEITLITLDFLDDLSCDDCVELVTFNVPGLTFQTNARIANTGTGANELNVTDAFTFLPVELTEFNAEKQGNNAFLSWLTAAETDNDYFAVQRSSNGVDFLEIGQVNGNATSTITNRYSFTDVNPGSGLSFYRLKQVDYDGTYEYSPIRSINFDGAVDMKIFLNPSSDLVNVFAGDDKINRITVFDQMGRVMNMIEEDAQSSTTLQVNSFAPGVYVLRIELESGSIESKKIVVR